MAAAPAAASSSSPRQRPSTASAHARAWDYQKAVPWPLGTLEKRRDREVKDWIDAAKSRPASAADTRNARATELAANNKPPRDPRLERPRSSAPRWRTSGSISARGGPPPPQHAGSGSSFERPGSAPASSPMRHGGDADAASIPPATSSPVAAQRTTAAQRHTPGLHPPPGSPEPGPECAPAALRHHKAVAAAVARSVEGIFTVPPSASPPEPDAAAQALAAQAAPREAAGELRLSSSLRQREHVTAVPWAGGDGLWTPRQLAERAALRVGELDERLLAYPGMGWLPRPPCDDGSRLVAPPRAHVEAPRGQASAPWTRRPQSARVHSFTVKPRPVHASGRAAASSPRSSPRVRVVSARSSPRSCRAQPQSARAAVLPAERGERGGSRSSSSDGQKPTDVHHRVRPSTEQRVIAAPPSAAASPGERLSEALLSAMGGVPHARDGKAPPRLSSSLRFPERGGLVPFTDVVHFRGKRDGRLRPVSSFRPRPVLRIPAHLHRIRLLLEKEMWLEAEAAAAASSSAAAASSSAAAASAEEHDEGQRAQHAAAPPPSEPVSNAVSAWYDTSDYGAHPSVGLHTESVVERQAAAALVATGWDTGGADSGQWDASAASALPQCDGPHALPSSAGRASSPRGGGGANPYANGSAAHAERIRQARACAALGALA